MQTSNPTHTVRPEVSKGSLRALRYLRANDLFETCCTVLLVWLLAFAAPLAWADATTPAHGVIGVQTKHLDPEFWIDAQRESARVVLDPAQIEKQNADLERLDATVHDVEGLPATLSRAAISAWIEPISVAPTAPLFDERGHSVPQSDLDAVLANAALDVIPLATSLRYGLVTQRADLRTFPTRRRVFRSPDDHDIDRFQESALFPGTPVAVLHASRDGQWWFVVSPRYAAWIEQPHVALGSTQQVFAYGRKTPYLIVTGATVETRFTPERPQVSQLQLDMGVRVPLLVDWPADQAVNGQHPYSGHVIELPQRAADGTLELVPALLPLNADVAREYLPLTPANLLRQSFKFLGERYGWGHAYAARDCSGFVSEVYRSFGVQLPRNTRDQGVSAAFDRIALDEHTSRAERLAMIRTLRAGDLVYIPGHVMLVIGREGENTYVIHDTTGITYRDGKTLRRVALNSVAVTPLEPLLADETRSYVDRIYSIQRIRARAAVDVGPQTELTR